MNDNKITVGDYRYNQRALSLVEKTLRQGRLTYGPLSQEFEERFAGLHGVNHAILCSSGTDALRIALRALAIKYGYPKNAKIALPALTFVATLNIIMDEGFEPVLIDIDPIHWHIDLDKLAAALEKDRHIYAVIPVHLFGQPVPYKRLHSMASYYDIQVLEDSCECMLAQSKDVWVGSMGNIAAFSLYAAHLVTTGVGGIVTTNNNQLAELARSLANHGRDGIYISIDDDNEGQKEIIKRRFNFEHRGFSSRITELQAAVGLPQLETLQADIDRRFYNAGVLGGLLAPYSKYLRLPVVRDENTHSFMMYPIVLEQGDKWHLINFLEDAGIETREMLPLTNQPAYREWLDPDDYPEAKFVNEQGFYIGCHQYLSDTQLEYIGAVFKTYFEGGHYAENK